MAGGFIDFIGGESVISYLSDQDKAALELFGLDAFGRSRVSNTAQRLDVEFLYNKQEEYFDETTNNGTVTHNANTRDLTLSLSDANNGSFAKMASYPVPYTPGNSQLGDITGVLNFAGLAGGEAEVFLRSSISGSATDLSTISQSDWLQLSGANDIDWSKSQLFGFDFQSLKVGKIRFYIVREGIPQVVANILNDNLYDSGYWQIPNLPIYWNIYTTGGTTYCELGYGDAANAIGFRWKIAANASATMKAICCTVKSEGGLDLWNMTGLARTVDMEQTAKTVSTTLVPVLSIRPKSTFNSLANLILSIPKSFSVTTDNPVRFVLLHDVTLTNASWADVDTGESCMEYDVSATAFSNGHAVASDYISTQAKNSGNSAGGLLGKTLLWDRQGSETGILTLAAVKTGTTDAAVLAALNWEELR